MPRREGVWLYCPECKKEIWVCDPNAVGSCNAPSHNTKVVALRRFVK